MITIIFDSPLNKGIVTLKDEKKIISFLKELKYSHEKLYENATRSDTPKLTVEIVNNNASINS